MYVCDLSTLSVCERDLGTLITCLMISPNVCDDQVCCDQASQVWVSVTAPRVRECIQGTLSVCESDQGL